MDLSFRFSALCGSVYKGGQLLFHPDGSRLLSPVGSRLSLFDLISATCHTLPFETRADIAATALSPDGAVLLAVDGGGRGLLINLRRGVMLQPINFKLRVADVKFSPCGRFFAITHGKRIQVWRAPGQERKFMQLSLYKTLAGFHDDVTVLAWSHDSRYILAGAKDATARIFPLQRSPGIKTFTLGGHKDRIVFATFEKDSLNAYTVSRDGTVLHWECSENTITVAREKAEREQVRNGHGVKRGVKAVRIAGLEAEEARQQSAAERRDEEHADGDDDDNEDDEWPAQNDEDAEEQEEEEGDDAADLVTGAVQPDDDASPHRRRRRADSDAEPDDNADSSTTTTTVIVPHWKLAEQGRKYFMQGSARVTCACFHAPSSVLTVGFSNGVFSLYEMPNLNVIHTLSISQRRITSVAVNNSGEWLALGSASLGQLLVWEWQSESYILKQQGHFYDTSVVAYSPDGHTIATGGDDGKVKLWNTASSFCFVTFKEHTAPITGVAFAQSGLAVVSASLDGTVRAFDTMRYRNFRSFTAPHPTQFSCLALDPSGELVCAGCQDTFEVVVWSMQTGKLLETLAGHKGPVSSLAFHPMEPVLLSGSWDRTVKLWSVFEGKGSRETIELQGDVVAVAFRPDGQQFATSSLKGAIEMWRYPSGQHVGAIEGRGDLAGGRRAGDKVTAKQLEAGRYYSSICYSADGACILAGGQSKYIAIYEANQRVLLRRFPLSSNRSLDGLSAKPNSKLDTPHGPLAMLDLDPDSDDEMGARKKPLPGVARGDFSARSVAPEIRTRAVHFSPTGRAWAAATTEGLVIFSLDDNFIFDPLDLDVDVTPENVRAVIAAGNHLKAVVMAFRLGEKALVQEAIESVPAHDVQLVASMLPTAYVSQLIKFIAVQVDASRHIGFYMTWCQHVLNSHGRFIKSHSGTMLPALKSLQKGVAVQRESLGKVCEQTRHSLRYLMHLMENAESSKDDAEIARDLGDIARRG